MTKSRSILGIPIENIESNAEQTAHTEELQKELVDILINTPNNVSRDIGAMTAHNTRFGEIKDILTKEQFEDVLDYVQWW
jgi:hypothetical protein